MCHDMCHCTGKDCDIRDKCYRYALHCDVKNCTSTLFSYFKDDFDKGDKICKYFVPLNYIN